MDLSRDRIREIYTPSGWDKSSPPPGAIPEITENQWFNQHLVYEPMSLKHSPIVALDGSWLEPVSAKLYSTFYCPCPADRTNHECELVYAGIAKELMLARWKRALHKARKITLWFYPDGSHAPPAWMKDGPTHRIICVMGNGAEVIVEHYPEAEAWCVVGEEGMKLDMRGADTNRLLDIDAWVPMWQRHKD